MKTKPLLILALAVFSLWPSLISPEASDQRPLVFAGDANFQPLEYLENGVPEGINVEVLQALSRAMGRRIEIRLMSWIKAQGMVLSGEADALTLMGRTEKREKLYDFSEPTLDMEFCFFVRTDDLTILEAEDIEGKVVGVTAGGFARQVLGKNPKFTLRVIKNNLQGFKLLKAGKIDAVATEKWVGAYTIEDNDIEGIRIIQKPLARSPGFIAVKKGNLGLLKEINEGIARLRRDGIIENIINEWTPERIVFLTRKRIERTIATAAAVGLAAVALAVLVWIAALRRKVKSRTASLQAASAELEAKVAQLNAEAAERSLAQKRLHRQTVALQGINQLFLAALGDCTEETLGEAALSIAQEVTESKIGFIGGIGPDGLLHDIALSQPGWEDCRLTDQSGQRRPPGNFQIHGIYGRVLKDGKGLFTNDPAGHPDSIGVPAGHPPLTSFLGAPLIAGGRTIGMIAMGNREGGYGEEELESLEFLASAVVEAFMRKRGEQALLASEARATSVLENLAEGVVFMDTSEAVVSINDSAKEILGHTLQGLTDPGLDPRGKILREDRTPFPVEEHPAMVALRTGKAVRDVVMGVPRPDGTMAWISANSRPVRDPLGRTVGAVVSFFDVTERKRIENINASRLHLLRFSETHSLDDLLEETLNEAEKLTHSLIGFYHFVDDDQKFLTLQNWSTRTKSEFCKAEAKGAHYAIAQAGVWVDCVYQRKPVIHNDYASLPHRKGMPEGHAEVIRVLVVPVMRGEKITAILGVGNKPTDYSQTDIETVSLLADLAWEVAVRKRAEEELENQREHLEELVAERTVELEAKTKELETFAYSVSHDLKAPLRGIDGYSRLLQEDHAGQLDDEGMTFLQNICVAAGHMNELIDDMLVYSRLERRAVHVAELDLPGLVEAVVAEHATAMEQSGAELVVDVPCRTVTAEAEGLAQALRNILDNAIKFSRAAPKPRIEIGGREAEDTCLLWVRDNGIGFDMRHHGRIFELFQRLHPGDEYAGTGVGLALVRKAMERMGGRVWAESAPGQGATFFLEIPK